MVVQSDHARMVDDFLTRLTRLHLSLEHYKEAAETIGTAMDNYMALKVIEFKHSLCLKGIRSIRNIYEKTLIGTYSVLHKIYAVYH